MTGYEALTSYPLQTEGFPNTRQYLLVPNEGFKSYVVYNKVTQGRTFGTDTQASTVASTLKSEGYEIPSIAGHVLISFQNMYMRIEFFNPATLEVTVIAKDTEFDESACPDCIVAIEQKLSSSTISVRDFLITTYSGYNFSTSHRVGITFDSGTSKYKLALGSNQTAMGSDLPFPVGVFVKPVGESKKVDIALGAMQSEIRDVKNQVNAIATVTTQAIARFPMR